MPRWCRFSYRRRLGRSMAAGLILGVTLLGTAGVNCDGEAQAAFRQTATEALGTGLKTIFDGLIDGVVAAVTSLGDGPSSTTGSSTSQ